MSKNKKAFGSKRAVPKNKKTGKSKITLDKLFKNNKFLLVFSFLMACILWLFFSQNSGVDTTASISDIPISIQLSDQAKEDGLVIFTGADTKATVPDFRQPPDARYCNKGRYSGCGGAGSQYDFDAEYLQPGADRKEQQRQNI